MSLGNGSGAAEQKNPDCDKAGVNLHLGAETFAETTGIVGIKTYSREKPRPAGVGMSAVVVAELQHDMSIDRIFRFVVGIIKYLHGHNRC